MAEVRSLRMKRFHSIMLALRGGGTDTMKALQNVITNHAVLLEDVGGKGQQTDQHWISPPLPSRPGAYPPRRPRHRTPPWRSQALVDQRLPLVMVGRRVHETAAGVLEDPHHDDISNIHLVEYVHGKHRAASHRACRRRNNREPYRNLYGHAGIRGREMARNGHKREREVSHVAAALIMATGYARS